MFNVRLFRVICTAMVIVAAAVSAPAGLARSQQLLERKQRDKGGYLEIGTGAAWLYYSELLARGPIVDGQRSWLEAREDSLGRDRFRIDTLLVDGAPKSDEYGINWALSASYRQFVTGTPLFVRPNVSILYGFRNTYDGSTQGHLEQDANAGVLPDTMADGTVAYWLLFDPYKGTKTNIFLSAGVGLGVRFENRGLRCDLSAGVGGWLWVRYIGGTLSKEHYRRVMVPLGAEFSMEIPEKRRVGFAIHATFMPRGSMQAFFDREEFNRVQKTSYDSLRCDPVVLGNRTGLQASLFLSRAVNNRAVLELRPWIEWYRLGESNVTTLEGFSGGRRGVVSEFLEPSSTTWWWGITMSVTKFMPYQ